MTYLFFRTLFHCVDLILSRSSVNFLVCSREFEFVPVSQESSGLHPYYILGTNSLNSANVTLSNKQTQVTKVEKVS